MAERREFALWLDCRYHEIRTEITIPCGKGGWEKVGQYEHQQQHQQRSHSIPMAPVLEVNHKEQSTGSSSATSSNNQQVTSRERSRPRETIEMDPRTDSKCGSFVVFSAGINSKAGGDPDLPLPAAAARGPLQY